MTTFWFIVVLLLAVILFAQAQPVGTGRLSETDVAGQNNSVWLAWTNRGIRSFAPVTNTIPSIQPTGPVAVAWSDLNHAGPTADATNEFRWYLRQRKWITNTNLLSPYPPTPDVYAPFLRHPSTNATLK